MHLTTAHHAVGVENEVTESPESAATLPREPANGMRTRGTAAPLWRSPTRPYSATGTVRPH
jgi:hypothetical protein